MNHVLEMIYREEIVAWFKVLFRHFLGETEENHEKVMKIGMRAKTWTRDLPNTRQDLAYYVRWLATGDLCLVTRLVTCDWLLVTMTVIRLVCLSGIWSWCGQKQFWTMKISDPRRGIEHLPSNLLPLALLTETLLLEIKFDFSCMQINNYILF